MPEPQDEIRAIEERYARRKQIPEASLYNPLDPYVCCARQERERALIRCLKRAGQVPVQDKRVLEVGYGGGMNLLDLIRLGFQPQNLVGNDLLEERLARARMVLPPALALIPGDASSLALEEESFDIVLQSKVFTSILGKSFQEKLASRMWTLVRPGGGILWFDFIWDNPKNPDVRGVPVKRIRQLFPGGLMLRCPLTLAPPIGRRLCKILPGLYPVFNAIPLLRTHVLCWIQKPRTGLEPGLDGPKDKPGAKMLKRALDIVGALVGLIVLLPALTIIAILVSRSSPGPVLFRQTRVGFQGKDFILFKFRTMTVRSGSETGAFDAGDGSRVTKVGRFLRATKLDELPQLWNIIRGDMALVGPRPEVRKWVEVNPERWAIVHAIRPGITDPAAILYRDEEKILASVPDPERRYREQILPRKLDLYEKYVRTRTFWGDLKILGQTAIAIIAGAPADPHASGRREVGIAAETQQTVEQHKR